MGFADKFVRFMRGDPLYQPDDVTVEEQQQSAAVTPGSSPEAVVPVVTINRLRNEATSGGVRVWATFQNDSGETLQLHELELLGRTIKLELILMPKGIKQDVLVYDGGALTDSNAGNAVLQYRTYQQDTLYKAVYEPQCKTVDVGLMGITEFSLQLPVSTI